VSDAITHEQHFTFIYLDNLLDLKI